MRSRFLIPVLFSALSVWPLDVARAQSSAGYGNRVYNGQIYTDIARLWRECSRYCAGRGEGQTFLTGARGAALYVNGFYLYNVLKDWCRKAGLPERCSPHGLRKAAARRLAEAGCSTHEIAAITGHRSLIEIGRYTRAVAQAKMAESALAKL